MIAADPLDHPAWSALSGRQRGVACVLGGACRYAPGYGIFAATADRSPACRADLARLVAEHGEVALLERDPPGAIPGVTIVSQDVGVQMLATRVSAGPARDVTIVTLGEEDARDMLALATLTQPGPFFEHTHRLGDFVGIRHGAQLVAMAGERMKPQGFTEVSGVCTDPAHRGRGYAAALMRLVAQRILDRGETPFLHAYASNHAAIALYETLGFARRCEVLMTRLAPG